MSVRNFKSGNFPSASITNFISMFTNIIFTHTFANSFPINMTCYSHKQTVQLSEYFLPIHPLGPALKGTNA